MRILSKIQSFLHNLFSSDYEETTNLQTDLVDTKEVEISANDSNSIGEVENDFPYHQNSAGRWVNQKGKFVSLKEVEAARKSPKLN